MEGFNPPVTPGKIVQDDWRFSIPIYQRLFVWESEQIDRLLDDLWTASQNNKDQPYYVGVITTVEQNDGENGRVFSVVDGQQRLTFLLLFFCDCLARNERTEDARKFVFVNDDPDKFPLRIQFLGRKDDEDDIRYCAKEDCCGKEWATIKNLNFRQFHDRMEVFIKKHEDWNNNKGKFIEFVFEKTSFLVNELAGFSNADLNLYFEKMNSTGRQLSPLEQLKGSFADQASEWNDCLNFEVSRDKAEATRKESPTQGGDGISVAAEQQNPIGEISSLDEIVTWSKSVVKEPAPNQELGVFSRLPMRPEVMALHALQLTLKKPEVKDLPTIQQFLEKTKMENNEPTIDFSPRHLLDTFKPITGPDSSSVVRASFINELNLKIAVETKGV